MKKLIICFLLILLYLALRAEKVGPLSQVYKPNSMEIANDKVYIVEGAVIKVYGLNDLKFVSEFGKKGEGPGELKVVPMLPNTITAYKNGLKESFYISPNFPGHSGHCRYGQ